MSEDHTCNLVFEKNVTHVHIHHTQPEQQQAAARQAGKYTCSCSAFELGAPVAPPPQVQHVPADDTEGGEI